ncbi:MAG: ribokinase [Phycisphaeraceae bacterium]
MPTEPENQTAEQPQSPRIVVVGSVNMDLVVRSERMPRPGETIRGHDFVTAPGGKGANQAVGAARLGAMCQMIGRVGDDMFGRQLLQNLQHSHVQTDHTLVTDRCPSGVAVIHVDEHGENAITIVAGANGRVSPDDVDATEAVIAGAQVMIVQLELPLATVCYAVNIARKHGVTTILDPAPAPSGGAPGSKLPDELHRVDIISPNQTEARLLTGEQVTSVAEAKLVGAELVRRGAGAAVMKMGEQGVVVVTRDGQVEHVRGFSVKVVDTTAAGDAFTAGLAVGLAEGLPLVRAARLGCATGALATTILGAQQAMPTRSQVERLMAGRM